jgi:hypothetical protein
MRDESITKSRQGYDQGQFAGSPGADEELKGTPKGALYPLG